MLEPPPLHPLGLRRMSLRFPLLWELVNLVVIVAKGATFLVVGAPFTEAWLLLGLCAASIALELVSRVAGGAGAATASDARSGDFFRVLDRESTQVSGGPTPK